MKKYRIFKYVHYDKYGHASVLYYFIKQKKTFLGITYWTKIQHYEDSWDGLYKTISKFPSEEDAAAHISNILCKATYIEKYREELVKDDCSC